jgi:hypothetical protein
MRHLRHIVLPAVVVALCVPSVASAHGSSKVGHLLPPHARVDGLKGGEAMGQAWARAYSLPATQSPLFGNAEPCWRMGRTGRILVGLAFQPVPCTVKQGTPVLVWGTTNTCDTVDPEFFGADKAAQVACNLELLAGVESIDLTIDGGKRVNLHSRRYFVCSPQQHVQLLAPNIWGADAGPATLTACGWVAWLKDLPAGQHTILTEAAATYGSEEISLVINVLDDN